MFALTIETDNDAFSDESDPDQGRREVAAILIEAANRMMFGHETEGCCRDINGNTVGKWELRP